jgi:hypothetical protein
MSKRKRANEEPDGGKMKSISIQYRETNHKMSWYDGCTAEDLEQVIPYSAAAFAVTNK